MRCPRGLQGNYFFCLALGTFFRDNRRGFAQTFLFSCSVFARIFSTKFLVPFCSSLIIFSRNGVNSCPRRPSPSIYLPSLPSLVVGVIVLVVFWGTDRANAICSDTRQGYDLPLVEF